MKIMWKNKFSGETGFVKTINHKGKYFENTFDVNEAKDYKKADKVIPTLEAYCSDNTYTAIEA